MERFNCIVVFHPQKDRILFCKRAKDPYRGLYNFVGGKAEPGEQPLDAAYRELKEETGIGRDQIHLFQMMDFTYYEQELLLEIYIGWLQNELPLTEEVNALEWLPLTEDFTDIRKFAGDQNIGHIVRVALKYPIEEKLKEGTSRLAGGCSVGIDGCRNGWIAAIIREGRLELQKFFDWKELTCQISFDACLVDMMIGLQGDDRQIRPDSAARTILKGRTATVFPAPCRKAVYGATKEERLAFNTQVLHKKFGSSTDAIIPKIREVDEFLQRNPAYKNVILESHPEVCFARLKGNVLRTDKHGWAGIQERLAVLADYFPGLTGEWIYFWSKKLKCREDDILDAVCLAVVANLMLQGRTEVIPRVPMADDTGIFMQMVIPRRSEDSAKKDIRRENDENRRNL